MSIKKLLKMFALTTVVLLTLVIVLAVIFFYTAPQIGGKATGERLEKMKQSPNYKDGYFFNTVETTMEFPGMGVMMEFFFNNNNREPEDQITTTAFDKALYQNENDTSILLTWFGHSSMLLQIEGTTFLIDPVFSQRASMFGFMGPKRFDYTNYADVDQMPEIDAVIISHDHYDHLDYETFTRLKLSIKKFYVPLSVGAHLEEWGVKPENIIELDWWDEVDFSDSLKLAFTPSRHFSGRALNDRFKTLWGSWVFKGANRSVYYSGDSGYFDGFKEIGEKYGPFDFAMMECGQYNEKWKNIHMMPEETAQAGADVNAKYVMPVHWGKFNLSLHGWKDPVQRFLKASEDKAYEYVLPEVGKTFEIKEELNTGWWERYN